VTRPFGNTLLVIRMLAYLGNTNPTMAMRPCVIGGIAGKRVSALEHRRCDSLSLSLSLFLPGNNGISTAKQATTSAALSDSCLENLSFNPSSWRSRRSRRPCPVEIASVFVPPSKFSGRSLPTLLHTDTRTRIRVSLAFGFIGSGGISDS